MDADISYELNIDTNDWEKFQGRSARNRAGASSSQQDKFQKRMDENLEKYYWEIAGEVKTLKAEWDWKQIIVIGDSDQANYFSAALNEKPDKIIYKNLKKATHGEIVRTAFEE